MLASVDLGCHAGWVRTDLDHLLGWCEQREVSVSWRVLATYLVRRFLKIHVDVTVCVSMLSSTCLTFAAVVPPSALLPSRHLSSCPQQAGTDHRGEARSRSGGGREGTCR
jgi:hypothetical protein